VTPKGKRCSCTHQGLTVLEPARDYIALGGIFVLPTHGKTPSYIDPWNTLPGPVASPFNAVVMQQSAGMSAGLAATVGTLGGLVSIPAGLKFNNSKQVQLAQIDSSGIRYTSQLVAALIKMPETRDAIQSQLKDGNRVFVVQEVYSGKNLSLKSSDNSGLAAAVEGAASIPSCSSGSSTTSSANAPSGTTPKAATSETKVSATNTKPATNKAATTASGGGTTSAAGGTQGSSNVGISVGACWANNATLSFQSTNAIPFAVRLNEVVNGPGNLLQVKITGFTLPNTALGNEDVAATTLMSPEDPTVSALIHTPHAAR